MKGARKIHHILKGQETSDGAGVKLRRYIGTRELMAHVVRLAHESGRNVSSMRADVRAGQPTEIDYINGYLVDRARAHGLHAPCNRTLVELIHLRSAHAGSPA